MHNTYFCDTYAIIELIKGNPNYQKYVDSILITSPFNLAELYYILLREYGTEFADGYFLLWSMSAVDIQNKVIPGAMQFRLANKKDNLSYTDCVGYTFSCQQNIRFLTGDQKFEGKESVEFVK